MKNTVERFYWHCDMREKCSRCERDAEFIAVVSADNPNSRMNERAFTYMLCVEHARVFAKSHEIDFDLHLAIRDKWRASEGWSGLEEKAKFVRRKDESSEG